MSKKKANEWIEKGLTLVKIGKFQEAIECFDRAIASDPLDIVAWLNRGLALIWVGKFQEAILCFDKVIEIDPNIPWALDRQGFCSRQAWQVSGSDELF